MGSVWQKRIRSEAPPKRTKAAAWQAARFLGFCAAGLAVAAVTGGAVRILALWYGLSMAGLTVAFWQRDAALLGKKKNGSLAWPAVVLFLPYLVGILVFASLKRLFLSSARQADEVAPGIYLGPRPRRSEIPKEVRYVVDLTAELPERAEVVAGRAYLLLPVLNRLVPGDDELGALLDEITPLKEPLLLHCGAGKGRSAEVAAALLLRRGLAQDLGEAEAILKDARPCVSLHPVQREQVRRLCPPSLAEPHSPKGSPAPRGAASP